jgi:hypothetical protein
MTPFCYFCTNYAVIYPFYDFYGLLNGTNGLQGRPWTKSLIVNNRGEKDFASWQWRGAALLFSLRR